MVFPFSKKIKLAASRKKLSAKAPAPPSSSPHPWLFAWLLRRPATRNDGSQIPGEDSVSDNAPSGACWAHRRPALLRPHQVFWRFWRICGGADSEKFPPDRKNCPLPQATRLSATFPAPPARLLAHLRIR